MSARFDGVRYGVPSFWTRLALSEPWSPGDLLMVTRTGELMRVVGQGARTRVERGIGSTPQALRDRDEVYYVGRAPGAS
jgi:hypothetical protein